MPAGIPGAVRDLTVGYRYNDLASRSRRCSPSTPGRSPASSSSRRRTEPPAPGFLAGLRALCDRHGAVLIFDEMITGFRWHLRGAQHVLRRQART